MLEGFIGAMKDGKTALMIAKTLSNYFEGRKIYANMKLQFPRPKGMGTKPTKRFSLLELVQFVDKPKEWVNLDLVWTEIYTNLECRLSSGSELNRIESYLIFQSGKRDIDIRWDAQMFGTIDNRLRWATLECGILYKVKGVWVQCERFGSIINASWCYRKNCKYSIWCQKNKDYVLKYVKWNGRRWKKRRLHFVQQYFSLYDANETVDFRETDRVSAYLSARKSIMRKALRERLKSHLKEETVERFLREIDEIAVSQGL